MKLTLRQAINILFFAIIVGGAVTWFYYGQKKGDEAATSPWRIGFLALADKAGVEDLNFKGFKTKMAKLGYEEGPGVVYIVKTGDNRIAGDIEKAAEEMNEAGFDIILTSSTSATKALKSLPGLKTPVFFLSAGRPSDLINNLSAPEGLITGMGEATAVFAGKRLGFLKEMVPSAKKVAFLMDRGHATALSAKKATEEAAKVLGIKIEVFEVDKLEDTLKTLSLISKDKGIDAYIACSCPSNTRYLKEFAEYFRKSKIPAISDEVEKGARIGWLATFSSDRGKAGERAAEKVLKILQGAPISSVPVEIADDVVLEINAKTAKEIGVVIPDYILRQADRVYNE